MVDFHVMPKATDLSSSASGIGSGPLDQLKNLVFGGSSGKNENLLVVSPYDEEPHQLDLRTLDVANQCLAKGLVGLKCLREDYATATYGLTSGMRWLNLFASMLRSPNSNGQISNST